MIADLAPDERLTIRGNAHTSELTVAGWNWVERAIRAQDEANVAGAIAAFRKAATIDNDAQAVTCVIALTDLHTDDPDLVFGERRAYDARFCRLLTATAEPHTNDRDPDRRLKVGYLSADFRAHSAAYLILPWIGKCDPFEVETHLYMTGRSQDPVTDLFREATDHWTDAAEMTEDELAARIRADGIDVLVDLSGYTQGNRLTVLARKPAPVQVTGWGSTMGTGLACQDYLVSDAVAIPPELSGHYREDIIRLPCLAAFRPPPQMPEIGPPPVETNGYPTFGYLGRPLKIGDEALRAWAAILRRTDGRLFLKNGEYDAEGVRLAVIERLIALGVRPERVSFTGHTGWSEHQEAYNRIDVALDTWPENGGTTIMDALAMGVPVVARLGTLAPGRQSSSILACVGLADPEPTTEGYVERAVAWSDDVDFLRETRLTLRGRLLGSAICRGEEYAAAWTAELRRVWRAWATG